MSATATDSALLLATSMQHLALSKQPFGQQEAANLYINQAWQMLLGAMQHNLQNSDMLQVLRGEPGIGKTSFLIRFVSNYQKDFQFFIVRGSGETSAEKLILHMLHMFTKHQDSSIVNNLKTLVAHLTQKINPEHPGVLIIDDAHLLEVEKLNQILETIDAINAALSGRIQVMLTGNVEIEELLGQCQSSYTDSGKVHTSLLRPYNLADTSAYLENQFQHAGSTVHSIFSQEQLVKIHTLSGGIATQIHSTAAAILNTPDSPEDNSLHNFINTYTEQLKHKKYLIPGTGLFLLFAIILFLLPEDRNAPDTNVNTNEILVLETGQPQNEKGLASSLNTDDQLDAKENTTSDEQDSSDQSIEQTDVISISKSVPVPTTLPDITYKLTAIPKPETKPEKPEKSTNKLPQIKKADIKESSNTANKPKLQKVIKNAWLLNRNLKGFTVQLLTSSSKKTVLQFFTSNKLENNAAIVKENKSYVLVFGNFETKDKARIALGKLPPALLKNSPWVRSIKSLPVNN